VARGDIVPARAWPYSSRREPPIDRERLPDDVGTRELLRRLFSDDVAAVEPLAGGVFSRASGFASDGRRYVLRLSTAPHGAEAFAKDDYAARLLASGSLPIPRVVRAGSADGMQYAITERVAGKTLAACSTAERSAALPAVLDTLEAIGRTDIGGSRGYGLWGADGNAPSTSWHAYLAAIVDDEPAGFYRGWRRLFRESFLERNVFDTVYRAMLALAVECPDRRELIHEDYQLENILVDEDSVSGVIDWANAMYGDALYDVARLAWWSARPGWWYDDGAAILRDRFGGAPRYDARIACYQCHMGLNDLRYYAKTDQRAEYEFFRARLLAIAGET